MADGSIINFKGTGELAKPMGKLIDKVSAAAGILYEPTRIRRKAKAEADARDIETQSRIAADRLLAQAEIENAELARRTIRRWVHEETRAQQNIEDVLDVAQKYLNEDSSPEKMDDDWVTHFFNECRSISDKEMQDLWSRVLAGEANQVGSFSKRTVSFLKTVSKTEAESFTRICSFTWYLSGRPVPLILDVHSDLCVRNGISHSVLNTLDSIGLIHFSGLTGFEFRDLPNAIPVFYGDESFRLQIQEKGRAKLKIGHTLFTNMGSELFRITRAPCLEGAIERALKHWAKQGHAPACFWPRQS